MHHTTFTMVFTTSLLGVTSCAFAADSRDSIAIEAAAQSWVAAFNARDGEALSRLATDEVMVIDPHGAVLSGQAARDQWRRAFAAAKGLTSKTKEIVVQGEVAWRVAVLTLATGSGQLISNDHSLEIWQRSNGQWRLHRQMSSGLLSRRELLPRPAPTEPVLDELHAPVH
jgi:ketosteroid isomerase-like protein